MIGTLKNEDILGYREQILKRIREKHIRTNCAHDGRLFLISTAYPGYWLEHLYDPVVWAKLFPEDKDIAISQLKLFLENQREDGKIPNCILDNDLMNSIPGRAKLYTGMDVCPPGVSIYYNQLQECVSIGSLALEIWKLDPDSQNLSWYYDCCARWDEWLCRNRMTRGLGLVETFGGFDTGHDHSGRFADIKYKHVPCDIPSDYSEGYPVDCELCPLISPDVNAVFYGNRMALAKMADILDKSDEAAAWREKAADTKSRLIEMCFDPEDYFFYDIDKHGKKIPVKSISITNLFCEDVLDADMAEEIYRRYLANPDEFATPYPFPGVSVSDPTWVYKMPLNDWGYYSQGNVALRTTRWMKRFGKTEDYRAIMEKWLSAWCREGILRFGQELHPITGEPSKASEWYSTTMLYLLYSMRELGLDATL